MGVERHTGHIFPHWILAQGRFREYNFVIYKTSLVLGSLPPKQTESNEITTGKYIDK